MGKKYDIMHAEMRVRSLRNAMECHHPLRLPFHNHYKYHLCSVESLTGPAVEKMAASSSTLMTLLYSLFKKILVSTPSCRRQSSSQCLLSQLSPSSLSLPAAFSSGEEDT